mgnify:CR=1 FL=1
MDNEELNGYLKEAKANLKKQIVQIDKELKIDDLTNESYMIFIYKYGKLIYIYFKS